MSHRFLPWTVVVMSVAVVGSGPAAVHAQIAPGAIGDSTTLALTLDDAVRRAIEHNPDLTVVRLGTEVEAARVGQSRGAFTLFVVPSIYVLVARTRAAAHERRPREARVAALAEAV